MRIILFGATGMVGQGVLRECLLDRDVEQVLAVGRNGTGLHHEKLRDLVHSDLFDLSSIKDTLSGFDACFFCLGVSSAGMGEVQYRRITYDLTRSIAEVLARRNAGMMFVYVSGAGTDGSGRSRAMWASVKGETENMLLQMPFRSACMFRPAAIIPKHGIQSKTRLYRIFYTLAGPLLPLLERALPRYVTTTEQVGRAMLAVAKSGAPKPVLENADIKAVAATESARSERRA